MLLVLGFHWNPLLKLVLLRFYGVALGVLGLPHCPVALLGFLWFDILVLLGLLIMFVSGGFCPVVPLVCLVIGKHGTKYNGWGGSLFRGP